MKVSDADVGESLAPSEPVSKQTDSAPVAAGTPTSINLPANRHDGETTATDSPIAITPEIEQMYIDELARQLNHDDDSIRENCDVSNDTNRTPGDDQTMNDGDQSATAEALDQPEQPMNTGGAATLTSTKTELSTATCQTSSIIEPSQHGDIKIDDVAGLAGAEPMLSSPPGETVNTDAESRGVKRKVSGDDLHDAGSFMSVPEFVTIHVVLVTRQVHRPVIRLVRPRA